MFYLTESWAVKKKPLCAQGAEIHFYYHTATQIHTDNFYQNVVQVAVPNKRTDQEGQKDEGPYVKWFGKFFTWSNIDIL